MKRLSYLEHHLEIHDDHFYSFDLNELGQVIKLSLYDPDYGDFYYNSDNLLKIISYYKDLEYLSLGLWEYNLTRLDGIEQLEKLKVFDIVETPHSLTNLDHLAELTNLREIYVPNSKITSIQFIKKLKTLEKLHVSNANISNLNEIAECKNLKALSVGDSVKDISPILECPALESLQLYNNPIENFEPISKLNKLHTLSIVGTKCSNLDFLENQNKLINLNISNNNLQDISPLKNAEGLAYLDASNNNLTQVKVIKQFSKLLRLNLRNNNIKRIEPVRHLVSLTDLDLSHNGDIEDWGLFNSKFGALRATYCGLNNLSFLLNQDKLSFLDVEGNQLTQIDDLKVHSNLTTLRLKNNQLTCPLPIEHFFSLGEIDLLDNVDYNAIYRTSGSNKSERIDGLLEQQANYYYSNGDYQKALSFKPNIDNLTKFRIYCDLFKKTKPDNHLYIYFYFLQAKRFIGSISETSAYLEHEVTGLFQKIETLNTADKQLLGEALRRGIHVKFELIKELHEFINKSSVTQIKDETLYFLAGENFVVIEKIERALGYLGELHNRNSPFAIPLKRNIHKILSSLYKSPSLKEKYSSILANNNYPTFSIKQDIENRFMLQYKIPKERRIYENQVNPYKFQKNVMQTESMFVKGIAILLLLFITFLILGIIFS